MNCRRARGLLGRYADGDLPPAWRAAVGKHLAACASCNRELQALRRTVDLVEALGEVPTGPELTAAVLSHLDRAGAREPGAWVLPWPGAVALGVAGLLLTAGIIAGALVVQAGLPGPMVSAVGSLASAAASVGARGLAALTVALASVLGTFAWPLFAILVSDVGLLIVLVTVGRRLARGKSLGLGALGAF